MEKVRLTITGNMRVAPSVWRMQLEGDVKAVKSPGEFVNIAIDGLYLRRPISVCDKCRNTIILLYKVVGEGTERMSQMQKGEELEVLTGLGNGFCTDIDAQRVLLAGGGIGIAPLYWLAKELINKGKEVMAALCFNTGEEVFYAEAFEELGVRDVRVIFRFLWLDGGTRKLESWLRNINFMRRGRLRINWRRFWMRLYRILLTKLLLFPCRRL